MTAPSDDVSFPKALATLTLGQSLGGAQMEALLGAMLDGKASAAQIAALLIALRMKGETGEDLAAGARALRARMVTVPTSSSLVIDVCGTGGDGAHSLNVSTAVSFVVAGCGVAIAKHGNRAVSSRAGAADVLEALGVGLAASPATLGQAIDDIGLAFLFAPNHHPGMAHVGPVRRELGVRTLFNMLGPLANPAGASRQLLGVFAPALLQPMADALRALGATKAWVVHGAGGMDELTLSGPNQVMMVEHGAIEHMEITAANFGLRPATPDAIAGGDAAFNAERLKALLDGEPGAYRDTVLFNAAAALLVADRADTMEDGLAMAGASIDDGRAHQVLQRLIAATQPPEGAA